jgi:hypothetical protein
MNRARDRLHSGWIKARDGGRDDGEGEDYGDCGERGVCGRKRI